MCFFKNKLTQISVGTWSVGSGLFTQTPKLYRGQEVRWCDASQQKGPGLESTGRLSVWSLNILSNFLSKFNDMNISLTGDSKLPVAVNVCFWELKQCLAKDIRLNKLIGQIWGRGTSGLQSNGGGGWDPGGGQQETGAELLKHSSFLFNSTLPSLKRI